MNDNYFIPLFDKDIVMNKEEYHDALLYISKNAIMKQIFSMNKPPEPFDPDGISFDNIEEQFQNINTSDIPFETEARDFKDELKDEREKNYALYQFAIPIYANYIRTENFCNKLFSHLLDLTLAPYPDITYQSISIDMKIIKNMIIKDIASGKRKPVENIFSNAWYSEYQFLNMLLDNDNKVNAENIMNPIMNCKCEWLYMNIDVKKYLKFIKNMVESKILKMSKEEFSDVIKNREEIVICYRLLPSPNPENLFNLIHNLQLYL